MKSILEIVEEANQEMRILISTVPRLCGERECRLDERAGSVWVTEDAVIARADSRQRLEYYGGFEYVSQDAKMVIGDWAIYLAAEDSSGRVQEVIDHVLNPEEDEHLDG